MTNEQISRWAYTTLQYAGVSGGADWQDHDDVSDGVRAVVAGLRRPLTTADVAAGILGRAVEIMGPERGVPNKASETAYQPAVVGWVLATVAVVRWAAGRPATSKEMLEAEAHERIVARVQGNRRGQPGRHDLDLMVRRTIGGRRAS